MLIDPWLDAVGGHNDQYAVDVLAAASEIGYACVLATNVRWSDDGAWPSATVETVFRYRPSTRYWLGPDGRCAHPIGVDGRVLDDTDGGSQGRWAGAAAMLHRWGDVYGPDRRQRIASYADDCGMLFARLGWRPDDVIFFPSLSEFDLLGIVRFLERSPESRAVAWHLQFHFDVFTGREHEHGAQRARLERFRRQFTAALALVPEHRLRLYCTSERMADQYDLMRVGRFRPLPYPASRTLEPRVCRPHDGPLRVVCAGAVRREKGRVALTQLIQELRAGPLGDGRMQLVLQADQKVLRRVLPRDLGRTAGILPKPDPGCGWPIVPVMYPLDSATYVQLIHQADIGLFLYDARRYSARAAGVLVEMLAAGIPVIVPAGCWLSEQIERPNAEYLEGLMGLAPAQPVHGSATEIDVPPGALALALRFRGLTPARASTYFELTARQFDDRAQAVGVPQTTVARRTEGGVSSLITLHAGTRRVRVTLARAYERGSVRVRSAEAVLLDADSVRRGALPGYPRGHVGLAAATLDEIPALLQDMSRYYGHYRRSAAHFAERWRHEHDAARTVETLAASGEGPTAVDRCGVV